MMFDNRSFNDKRKYTSFVAVFLMFFAFASMTLTVVAQKGTIVRQNVVFTKGASSTTIRGKADWGTAYFYTFRAKAGQRLTIALIGKPIFDFWSVGATRDEDESLEGETEEPGKWTGTLRKSGTYRIVVSHEIDGVEKAPFTLKVNIR